MIALYIVSTLFLISIYVWSYISDVKKSVTQNLMMVIMILSNIGYLTVALSTQTSELILATKIVYLGGIFFPLLYFFTVCEICHVTLRKSIVLSLVGIQTLLYCLVCTIGYLPWFYSSISLARENGLAVTVKEYGPFHILYPLTLYLYFLAALAMIAWAMVKKKNINNLELQYMIASAAIGVGMYFVSRGFHFKYDIMTFAYCILMIGSLIPVYHSNLFTVQENRDIIKEQLSYTAFITFNRQMQYMGSNELAKKIFPELSEIQVGHALTHISDQLGAMLADLQKFREEIRTQDSHIHVHQKSKTIKIGEAYYDTVIHTIHNFRNHLAGFTIELTDETDHHCMVEMTERYNAQLFEQVENKTRRIRDIQEKTVLGMAQMVESRDLSTGGHIKRTSDVVRIFSDKINESDYAISPRFLNLVARSAPMHDLGKIGVDDAILRKRGRFTDEEYEIMKTHTTIGGKMVTDILTDVEEENVVRIARNVAKYHHEKYDGTGYPEGLSGTDIPVEARIMALADVFDALVSERCYKKAYSYDEAFRIIKEDAGTHFDYDLAMIFLKCRPELEAYYDKSNGRETARENSVLE